jgi:hypothetical protein
MSRESASDSGLPQLSFHRATFATTDNRKPNWPLHRATEGKSPIFPDKRPFFTQLEIIQGVFPEMCQNQPFSIEVSHFLHTITEDWALNRFLSS